MGKGLGHIGRAIEAILIAEPHNAFTVDDLCDRVFRGVNRIEKKHRVSVIRAAKSAAMRRSNLDWWRSEQLGGMLIFFTADNVMSYSMFRLKADRFACYRNNDTRRVWLRPVTEQQLRARLSEGGSDHKHVVPGGTYWRHVEIWKAKRGGDTKRVEKLRAEINRSLLLMGLG